MKSEVVKSKSLVFRRNKVGERTDPWVTPGMIEWKQDDDDFTTTEIGLLEKTSENYGKFLGTFF